MGRGTLVWSPTRPVEALFIVKQGRVRTYRTAADGRSLTTAIISPGELFGQMPVMGLRMDDGYAESSNPASCVS